MKSWSDIVEDAKESWNDLTDDVKEELRDIDWEKIFDSDTFKKIASLVVGDKIFAYSLLRYVVNQAAENSSDSSGWQLAEKTLTAVDNNLSNVLLINDPNSEIQTINASNVSSNLILVGNALSNLIFAGNGNSTLWGGGEGNNTLTGGNSRDEFWYLGGGNDLVSNFVTGMAANSDIAILIGNLANVSRSGETVSIKLSDGNSISLNTGSASSDDVVMYSADGENIFGAKIADSLANDLTYYGGANYFQLSNAGNLKVTDSENNSIWLDGSAEKIFSNILNIDASTSTGENILVGDSNSNQIISGSGSSSLWGGVGGDDVLTGGAGVDNFFFGKNDGADTIFNASSSDFVNFYDANLSDLISADVSENLISATFNTGGTLQINCSENLSPIFKLADGNFQFNREKNSWQQI